MNDFLIDTHIFLWLTFSPEKLSSTTLEQLQNRQNQVLVSAVSFWEISLKYQLGKLHLSGISPHELLPVAHQMGLKILDFSTQELATFYQLPLIEGHKVPFDRLIIWQCITQNKTLVSHDAKLTGYQTIGLNVIS